MVEQPTKVWSYDPDIEPPEPTIGLRPRAYAFGRTAGDVDPTENVVPLFLSDPDGEPDPAEFGIDTSPQEPRKSSFLTKFLLATVAASAIALASAWCWSDATRDILISAKVSMSTLLPAPATSAQPDASAQLTPRDVEIREPARLQASPNPAPVTPQQVVAVPSREEISSAYQAALSRISAAAPATPAPSDAVPPAPARRTDAGEAASLKQNTSDAKVAQSETDNDILFRQFQAWQAEQATKDAQKETASRIENARAQIRVAKPQ